MTFGVTVIFYLVIGAGVAVAVLLAEEGSGPSWRAFRAGSAVLFWPLYLPIVLAGRKAEPAADSPAPAPPSDAMAAAIAQVEAELDAAFSSLDGWAEDVLAREEEKIRELRTVWTAQATRIREMDHLLSQAEDEVQRSKGPGLAPVGEPHERWLQSEQARQANLDRLRQVRKRAFDDLMGTLAWVRELVSMIHLAKFTGAPASRAEELVAQIAAAVEGVSAVTWQDGPTTEPDWRPESVGTRQ
ncbi:MAG TPA: hypothetical protein VGZ22_17675 [Isosphaeraceae bacterium]|jgi:hypothetical protein|nr:hypothetical protein [Isosphaeraceae bacterium]